MCKLLSRIYRMPKIAYKPAEQRACTAYNLVLASVCEIIVER